MKVHTAQKIILAVRKGHLC